MCFGKSMEQLCIDIKTDKDMTLSVKTIDHKLSLFLCLHNNKIKKLSLPSISISNVLRNNGDDDRKWICHEQDQSQSVSPSS